MKKLVVLLTGMVLLQGCATIMNGSNDMVNISSTPRGANFSIRDNGYGDGNFLEVVATGTTPQNVLLARKTRLFGNEYSVQFKKEGYQNKTVPMKKTTSWWFYSNIIFGGPIGVIIDSITGAADDLHSVRAKLQSNLLHK